MYITHILTLQLNQETQETIVTLKIIAHRSVTNSHQSCVIIPELSQCNTVFNSNRYTFHKTVHAEMKGVAEKKTMFYMVRASLKDLHSYLNFHSFLKH